VANQLPFYSGHTEKKLQAIENYLQRFLLVVSKQKFKTVYIDAFAGTGSLPIKQDTGGLLDIDDAQEIVQGSAIRALKLAPGFDRYIFIETSAAKLDELRETVAKSGASKAKCEFVCGDAGVEIGKLCPLLSERDVRSVVFLDPFGNQVSWDTLQALASTKHVDLWYLFPAGHGVHRQISGQGTFTPEQEQSLNRLFGPHPWHSAFVGLETRNDLFGTTIRSVKVADVEDITRFMIKCMDTIFDGGVCQHWLPLGRDGAHQYSLIFAMANPAARATKIGHDIAKHIMTRK
jgi:three-Cys-motif partner protein